MLTVSATKSLNVKRNKDYNSITFGNNQLHQYGALSNLLKEPKEFNPSLLAITRDAGKPICLASITRNTQRKGMSKAHPSMPLCSSFSFQFPNFEIMAYTKPDYRRKGIAKKTIEFLLKKSRVAKSDVIYVYSHSMVSILRKLGFNNVTNLHEYTP